jgi:hypothetical protein
LEGVATPATCPYVDLMGAMTIRTAYFFVQCPHHLEEKVQDSSCRWIPSILGTPTAVVSAVMFLGEDLLAYLVLALGGALAVGNVLAVVRPPAKPREEGDLAQAPVARSLAMAALGALAAFWALASLAFG